MEDKIKMAGTAGFALEGFKIMQIKFNEKSEVLRQIFVKPHNMRVVEATKPSDRTLFIANIPPWMDANKIRELFQPYGSIEAVYLEFSPNPGPPTQQAHPLFPVERDPYLTGNGYKFAYIVYQRSSSVRECIYSLDESEKVKIASESKNPILTGVNKWNSQYNSKIGVGRQEILKEVESFMSSYDAARAVQVKKVEEDAEPDDDGWTTVTKLSKKKLSKRLKEEEYSVEKRGKKGRRKKKKKTDLQNFYAHQIKNEKIEQIRELRQKFEQDKLKITKMKADRKFKPF